LFEPHAGIIAKGSRGVDYGHKLNFDTGRSGLILDLVIEAGNPADGGHASRENSRRAKAWGVRDMAFRKKTGLRVEDLVKSNWVYRKLRNFHAGIRAGISCLKRAYGLGRDTWRGLDRFKTYVWSSVVVAYNLALLTLLKPV
jgi:IS5 family transposase